MTPDSKRSDPPSDRPEGEPERRSEVTAEARRLISHVDPHGPLHHGADRLVWVEHRNTELLFLELGRGTAEDGEATHAAFVDVLSSKLPGSILFLADLSQAVFWPGVALKWQHAQDLLASRCKGIAVVGVSGMIRTACNIFLDVARASGNPVPDRVRFFFEVDAAKNWLVERK